MQVSISGRHFDVSDRIRSHVEEEAAKLERFYSPVIDCQVIITEENRLRKVDVVVNVHGQTLKASRQVESAYVAIDGAMDKIKRQLKKLHDKRRKRRGNVANAFAEEASEEEE